MRIEFWVDYVCPITYVTHQNLLLALKELGLDDSDILYRSYQLTKEFFDAHKNDEEIIKIVKKYFPNKITSFEHFKTDNIHQIAHLSKRHKLGKEFTAEVLNRKFINEEDINSFEVLLNIAEAIGLNIDETKEVLKTQCYTKQINTNKTNAEGRGINLIPHIRINTKNNFKGYYSKDELKTHIKSILNNKPKTVTECSGEICEY